MPVVRIDFKDGVLDEALAPLVAQEIATYGSLRFSTKYMPMRREDFSVIFTPITAWSQSRYDMLVTISLHAYQERLKNPDGMARDLAKILSGMLALHDTKISIGVTLVLSELGWGAASAS